MKGISGYCVMRAVNTDARSTPDSRMMITAKQVVAHRNVT